LGVSDDGGGAVLRTAVRGVVWEGVDRGIEQGMRNPKLPLQQLPRVQGGGFSPLPCRLY
jgi:hypothetical protein